MTRYLGTLQGAIRVAERELATLEMPMEVTLTIGEGILPMTGGLALAAMVVQANLATPTVQMLVTTMISSGIVDHNLCLAGSV